MNILINIVITFFQAGLAAWSVTGFSMDKAAIGAVIGAGISAIWNIIVKPFLIKKGYIRA